MQDTERASHRSLDLPACPAVLVERLGLTHPIIGLYEVFDPAPFKPLDRPAPGRCVFAFYDDWRAGRTLHLDAGSYGCAGAGHALLGVHGLRADDLARYLVDEEGVMDTHQAMAEALAAERPRRPACPHVVIGPLRVGQQQYLRTVTFFATPNQLSGLVMAAHYHHPVPDVPPVIVPSSSGCRKLIPFESTNQPQAAIGATDIGIRRFLPADVLAFTVTPPMYTPAVRAVRRELPLQGGPSANAGGTGPSNACPPTRPGPNGVGTAD